MKNEMTVVSQQLIADRVYKLVLQGDITKEMKTPGQFVHVRVSDSTENVLRRPISISNIDYNSSQMTLIYRQDGEGTRKMTKFVEGDTVDLLVPLGNGFPLHDYTHVLIVGGGIGVPPLYELSKRLNEKGVKTTHVLGFNSKKDVFYEDEFKALGQTYITTVDGSYGEKGFVTDVIETLNDSFDAFYSCGPKVMLKVLSETLTIDGYISLEERMGCGFGVCYACIAEKSDGSFIKLCTEGPVFKKGEIVL